MPEAQHKVKPEAYRRARQLRREMPPAEKLLWHKLRQLPKEWGLSFRRQQPIHPYIVDFICVKHRLIIELDGMSHDNRQTQDAARDTHITKLGYRIIRFDNAEVIKNPDGVVSTILKRIHENKLPEEQRDSSPLEGEVGWGVLSNEKHP